MAQDMGREPLPQPDGQAVAVDDPPRPLAAEAPAAAVEKHGIGVAPPRPPGRDHGRSTGRAEPRLHGFAGVPPDRHQALLAPFAEGDDGMALEIDPPDVEPHRLGDPQPGPVEELEQGAVTTGGGVIAPDRLQQAAHLVLGERLGERLGQARGGDVSRGVGHRRALVDEEAVEAAHGRQGPGHGGGPATGVHEVGDVALDVGLGDRGRSQSLLPEPGLVGQQVTPVGGDGVAGPAPFDRQPRQVLL